jgi:hypothetical protein
LIVSLGRTKPNYFYTRHGKVFYFGLSLILNYADLDLQGNLGAFGWPAKKPESMFPQGGIGIGLEGKGEGLIVASLDHGHSGVHLDPWEPILPKKDQGLIAYSQPAHVDNNFLTSSLREFNLVGTVQLER